MRIVLEDGFAMEKGTGIGQYTRNLLCQLKKRPEICDILLIEKPFLNKISPRALRRAVYITWLNSYLQLFLRRNRVDIIHFTNYLVPILRLSSAKYVVTIHDLTAWRFPETLPQTYVFYIKWAISHAVKTVDLILTVSEALKREIVDLFEIDNQKIRVIYNGVAENFWELPKRSSDERGVVQEKFGIKKDFLLFVGTLEERKNIMTLVKAFEIISNYKNLQLVLVGRPGYGFSRLSQYLDEHHLKGDVVLTGYVSEEEKIALYDSASVFAYPSIYEGFGIPLVEAMVRRVPIVASRIPATEEVAGEAAVYYDNLYDHEALAKEILRVLENESLRDDMVRKGFQQAQKFSWEKIVKQYLEACQELIRADKR